MTSFDDRKNAFENNFAHQEKLSFEIEARCSKLFGLWAAEQMGLSGAEASSYAGEVVAANLDEAGFEDVLRKVRSDFENKGVQINDALINQALNGALQEARKQFSE
jgi:hypothetical protein